MENNDVDNSFPKWRKNLNTFFSVLMLSYPRTLDVILLILMYQVNGLFWKNVFAVILILHVLTVIVALVYFGLWLSRVQPENILVKRFYISVGGAIALIISDILINSLHYLEEWVGIIVFVGFFAVVLTFGNVFGMAVAMSKGWMAHLREEKEARISSQKAVY